MKYISGIHALNLNCDLDTCGDWHQSALKWDHIKLYESENSLWNDYGIESNKSIPEHEETYHVANHIRALLDLLYDKNFALAQGMNHNFIGNEKYDIEIFKQVLLMKKTWLLGWNQWFYE